MKRRDYASQKRGVSAHCEHQKVLSSMDLKPKLSILRHSFTAFLYMFSLSDLTISASLFPSTHAVDEKAAQKRENLSTSRAADDAAAAAARGRVFDFTTIAERELAPLEKYHIRHTPSLTALSESELHL